MKNKCSLCGKTFYTQEKRVYCSKECHNESMRRRPATETQLYFLSLGSKYHSEERRRKTKESNRKTFSEHPEIIEKRSGKNHYNWKGGISKLPYGEEFNTELKDKIRFRDDFKCGLCGITQEEYLSSSGSKLHIHHIDYNKKNNNKNNLVSLCTKCHMKTNYLRECWTNYFSTRNRILNEIDNHFPMTIIYSYGVFDLLHRGHLNLLRKAKSLGDYLIVGVVSDEAVREKKGKNRPVRKQIERASMINSLKCVDKVVLQKNYDPSDELRFFYESGIKISILAKGDDWDYIPGQETIKDLGGKLIKLPYTKGISTSSMIKKIRGEK